MTYEVGESVEYKPPGGPVGVFTITRRMPHDPSGERIYRIKSDLEFCERNVLESALTKLALSATAPPTMWDKRRPASR
jgi:hypothetical protein